MHSAMTAVWDAARSALIHKPCCDGAMRGRAGCLCAMLRTPEDDLATLKCHPRLFVCGMYTKYQGVASARFWFNGYSFVLTHVYGLSVHFC